MESRIENPGALLEAAGGYWKSCAVQAAVKLEVFDGIGAVLVSGEELAARMGASTRGLVMLLNVLVSMGLLRREGSRYGNTPFSSRFLMKDSPDYMGYMIRHYHHMVEAWARLPEAVLSGRPVQQRSFEEESERESFLMGMFNIAKGIAPRIASEVDLSGRRRLLDLGGGPGTYSIYFCLENPGLKATVFDRPTTRPYALRTIQRFGLADRIDFVGGDYTQQDIPGRYDVAWLSHILHAEGPDTCERIVRRAVSALEPGGLILVHDFILEDSGDAPFFPALFSLNMLVNTEEGRSYTEGRIREWLSGAGVHHIERLPFRGPTDSSILQGTVAEP